MSKLTTSTIKRKRAPKGAGRIFKRDTRGKEHPPESPINAAYWIAYTVPNPNGGTGKRVQHALKDNDGRSITNRSAAEAARKRIVAPYQTRDRIAIAKALQSAVADAETANVAAEDEANPPLTLRRAETAYLASPRKPDSGKRTQENYLNQWKRFCEWMNTHHPAVVYMRDVDFNQVGVNAG